MNILRAGAVIFLIGVLSGCIGSVAATGKGGERAAVRTVITADDVEDVVAVATTAYGVVRRLKPEWLRKRSPRTTMQFAQQQWEGEIQVYVNGHRMGGPDNLQYVTAESVREVRYLNAAEATRFGMGHQHGAIMVETW